MALTTNGMALQIEEMAKFLAWYDDKPTHHTQMEAKLTYRLSLLDEDFQTLIRGNNPSEPILERITSFFVEEVRGKLMERGETMGKATTKLITKLAGGNCKYLKYHGRTSNNGESNANMSQLNTLPELPDDWTQQVRQSNKYQYNILAYGISDDSNDERDEHENTNENQEDGDNNYQNQVFNLIHFDEPGATNNNNDEVRDNEAESASSVDSQTTVITGGKRQYELTIDRLNKQLDHEKTQREIERKELRKQINDYQREYEGFLKAEKNQRDLVVTQEAEIDKLNDQLNLLREEKTKAQNKFERKLLKLQQEMEDLRTFQDFDNQFQCLEDQRRKEREWKERQTERLQRLQRSKIMVSDCQYQKVPNVEAQVQQRAKPSMLKPTVQGGHVPKAYQDLTRVKKVVPQQQVDYESYKSNQDDSDYWEEPYYKTGARKMSRSKAVSFDNLSTEFECTDDEALESESEVYTPNFRHPYMSGWRPDEGYGWLPGQGSMSNLKPHMMQCQIDKLHGKEDDVFQWFRGVEKIAKSCRWSQAELGRQLPVYLGGEADMFWRQLPKDKQYDYTTIKNWLLKKLRAGNSNEMSRKFFEAKQEEDESPGSFSVRLKSYLEQIPKVKRTIDTRQLIRQFVQSLKPDVAMVMANSNFRSFEEAVEAAERVDKYTRRSEFCNAVTTSNPRERTGNQEQQKWTCLNCGAEDHSVIMCKTVDKNWVCDYCSRLRGRTVKGHREACCLRKVNDIKYGRAGNEQTLSKEANSGSKEPQNAKH